jgi:uncharacterized protein (DUF849 family)
MSHKVIITCAVTGAGDSVSKSPAVPVTPQQIADSAIEAARAGAALVHLHVRDPETGKPSIDGRLFREVVERIRDSDVNVIINLTTGEGGMLGVNDRRLSNTLINDELKTPEERFGHVAENLPEVCTLDIGTLNMGSHGVFVNTNADVARIADLARDAGVLTEMEVFDAGHIEYARHLLDTGRIKGPGFFQLCMGVPGGSPGTGEALVYMKSLLPKDAVWAAFGVGPTQFPIVAQSVILGGHVRVGLEDNLYIERGVLAPSNAALVEKAGKIVELLGSSIATPTEARAILGLN